MTKKNNTDKYQSIYRLPKAERVVEIKKLSGYERVEYLEFMRSKDAQIVRGRFRNYETPGGATEFSLKLHKGDEVVNWLFEDDGVYSVPLGVARHLKENTWSPIYSHVPGEVGVQSAQGARIGKNSQPGVVQRITRKLRRFDFDSLEFSADLDAELPAVSLYTVENLGA